MKSTKRILTLVFAVVILLSTVNVAKADESYVKKSSKHKVTKSHGTTREARYKRHKRSSFFDFWKKFKDRKINRDKKNKDDKKLTHEPNLYIACDGAYKVFVGDEKRESVPVTARRSLRKKNWEKIHKYYFKDLDKSSVIGVVGENVATADISGLQVVYKVDGKYAVTGEDWYVFVPKGDKVKPEKINGKEWYEEGYQAKDGEWVKATKLRKREIKQIAPIMHKLITKGWKFGDGYNYIWSKQYTKYFVKRVDDECVTTLVGIDKKVYFRNKMPNGPVDEKVTLTLHANNGTEKKFVKELASGASYKLNNPNFEFPSHNLIGWSKTRGGDVDFAVGEEYKMKDKDVDLYAVWEEQEEFF